MPIRVQRKRVKGWRMPPNTVSVTRPGKFGNPFKVGQPFYFTAFAEILTIDRSLELFEWSIKERGYPVSKKEIKKELKGKNLACFCPLNQKCHADILLKIAN